MSHDLLRQRAADALRRLTGRAAEGVAHAPGRVNLIGEHTDYNGGFALPCAIDRGTAVAWAARDDGQVVVHAPDIAADGAAASDRFALSAMLDGNGQQPWSAYVRGMLLECVAREGLPALGLDLAIAGDLPTGAGLSSSASLCLAVGHALLGASGQQRSRTVMALAAQRAENDFVGCRCGNMDQLAVAHGRAGHALLIDCRALAITPVPLPAGLAVVVAHSGVRRGLVDSAYNDRRADCDRAAAALGVAQLRDASLAMLQSATLDATALRRARHVLTENTRTLALAQALAACDWPQIGPLLAQSHASLRDDFAVTVPAVDRLVDVMQQAIGPAGGARMTGGGFGGCAVALVPSSRSAAVADAVARDYRDPQGQPAAVWQLEAADGAGHAPA